MVHLLSWPISFFFYSLVCFHIIKLCIFFWGGSYVFYNSINDCILFLDFFFPFSAIRFIHIYCIFLQFVAYGEDMVFYDKHPYTLPIHSSRSSILYHNKWCCVRNSLVWVLLVHEACIYLIYLIKFCSVAISSNFHNNEFLKFN